MAKLQRRGVKLVGGPLDGQTYTPGKLGDTVQILVPPGDLKKLAHELEWATYTPDADDPHTYHYVPPTVKD